MICSKIVDYNTLVIFKPNKVSAIYENKENNKAETMLCMCYLIHMTYLVYWSYIALHLVYTLVF